MPAPPSGDAPVTADAAAPALLSHEVQAGPAPSPLVERGTPTADDERVAELERLLARRTAERNAARQEIERQVLAAGQVRNADGNALSARLHQVVGELRRLSEELDVRNTALATANWRLEQRVAERTAALEAALDARRESEARFRSVAENMPQLVWTSLPEGRWDYANRRWQAYTGQPVRDARDHGWLAKVHPDDRPATMEAWRGASRSGARLLVEHRLRSAEGAWRWFETQALPVRGGLDGAPHWVGSSTDVQARKTAEEAIRQANQALQRDLSALRGDLAESEARFRAYFRISSDALFVVACLPDGRFLHEALNQPFERLTGLWSERADGREARAFMPAAAAAVFEEHYRRCSESDAPHLFDALLALPAGDRMLRISLMPALGSGAGGASTRCLLGSARDAGELGLLRPPPDLDA